MIGRPHDPGDDVRVLSGAVRGEDLDGHHGDAVVADAGDTGAVVDRGSRERGHPRAVAVRVAGAAAERRVAVDDREVTDRVDAGVQDGDRRRPGGVGHAVRLVPTDRGEGPLIGIGRVVRRGLGLADAVAVDRVDARICAVRGDRIRRRGRCDFDDVHPQGWDRGCSTPPPRASTADSSSAVRPGTRRTISESVTEGASEGEGSELGSEEGLASGVGSGAVVGSGEGSGLGSGEGSGLGSGEGLESGLGDSIGVSSTTCAIAIAELPIDERTTKSGTIKEMSRKKETPAQAIRWRRSH